MSSRASLAYTIGRDIDHELKQALEQLLELRREFGVQPKR